MRPIKRRVTEVNEKVDIDVVRPGALMTTLHSVAVEMRQNPSSEGKDKNQHTDVQKRLIDVKADCLAVIKRMAEPKAE